MGKTRDLKKIRDTKGTFHAKMDTIKDRNCMDVTEAEDSKKRWQEYTEELYKKDLHDSDNHDGVITHLELDILECEVKWTLGSITMKKASGGALIPTDLFQILKDDAVKVLHSICQQIWKTQEWPQDWKRSVFIPIPKKGNAKECSNYCTILLISHASKAILKILQARLQQCMNQKLPDVEARFRKGRETRNQIANICWIMGFPCSSVGKESACNAGDSGLILGWEDPLEKEMATHSSILAWSIPQTEEPGRLQVPWDLKSPTQLSN